MHNCRSCKKDKTEEEMHRYGNGVLGRTCNDCYDKGKKAAGGVER